MWSGSGVDVTQDPNETTVPIPIDQALNSAQQAANSPESSPPASTASTDTADLAGTANTADTQSPTDPQSLAQSSATMALGTIASRLTGMVRDIAIVAAIGFGVFGDTYSVANTVPNIIYILIAGGALNAIFIPQLVRHLEHDLDKGNEYADRLLTLVTLILLGVTFIVTIAAPSIAPEEMEMYFLRCGLEAQMEKNALANAGEEIRKQTPLELENTFLFLSNNKCKLMGVSIP